LFSWVLAWSTSSEALEDQVPEVDVTARSDEGEIIGPYNQPRWSARGRFSANTDVYVLPPLSFFLDVDYHGTFPRRGKPDNLFTQEFELGLPYRFQVAFELSQEAQDGHRQIPGAVIEARYALANWGKIPLNPTLMVEYRLGIGKQYAVEAGQNQGEDTNSSNVEGIERNAMPDVPDSYEITLLVGQEIRESIEFAANIFFDQDIGGVRQREIGFSTATAYEIHGGTLKVGFETSYRNVSENDDPEGAQNIFELGPSLAFKPSRRTRFDLASLFGITHQSPSIDLFVVFSVDFGTDAAKEIEPPAVRGGRH